MRYDCVLFDLDGTLIDSLADITANANRSLAAFGLPPLDAEVVRRLVGHGVRHLVEGCFAGRARSLDAAVETFRRAYLAHPCEATVPYPGVVETLERIRLARLGVVSNKPQALSELVLRHLGMREFFSIVFGGDTLPLRKPDPAPVREAMRILGAQPERTLVVGDGVPDFEAGRAAGTHVCLVRYGYDSGGAIDALRPDYAVDRFAEIAPIVAGERAPASP
jgi:phosphoglycolate phosphatase